MKLVNVSQDVLLSERVFKANSLKEKVIGLLGRDDFPLEDCLFIPSCRNIHTFFMKFPIDAVFTDKDLKVVKIYDHLKPQRVSSFVFKGKHVFEFKAQNISKKVKTGDQLRCG